MLSQLFALSKKGAGDLKKGILSSACANLSLMLFMGLLMMIVSELVQPYMGGQRSIPNIWVYTALSVLLLGVILLANVWEYRSTYIASYEESATRRITLAEKLRRLPLSFFGEHDLAELTTSMMNDCTELERTFSGAIPKLFGSVASILVFMAGLFVLDWRMALTLFSVFPASLLLMAGSKHLQDQAGTKRLDAKLKAADGIQEYLEAIQDIKACNQTDKYLSELNQKLDNVAKASIRMEMTSGSLLVSAQMILRMGFALVVLIGASLFTSGAIDLLTYLLFLVAASRIYEPLGGVMMQLGEIFNSQLQIKRMKGIQNHAEQEGKKHCPNQGFDICFDRVSFSYSNREQVLKDVSFTARQGEVTALVGPSGSGKSTVAKLSARFWDTTGGRITLGGADISKVDPEILLKNYSIVFQDVVLFNDTVLENIRLGRRDATDEEVYRAAKTAMCDDFIREMPQGYQTIIGENGSTLSGGERQRISIARALLKDAPVILLDEATASLDAENETQVQMAITRLIQGKTVLIIAHRMRTVTAADKIVVLDDGQVVQQGTSDALMAQDGLYRRLVSLQRESVNWSLQ